MKVHILGLVLSLQFICNDMAAQQVDLKQFNDFEKNRHFYLTQKIQKLDLSQKPVSPASCMIKRIPFNETEINSIPECVCYAAFFCKMETQMLNHFNIRVKLRLGDFDSYEKK